MITLNIETIKSNIQIEHQSSRMQIENISSGIRIEKQDAKLDVYTRSPKLEIDSYPAFKQLNYRNTGDFMRYYGSISQQNATEAVSEYAGDGDAMMKIESKGDTIGAISDRKAARFGGDTVNIEYFPQEPIDIRVIEGVTGADFAPGFINISSEAKLNINVDRGGVTYNIDRFPKVNIETMGSVIDQKI